MEFADADKLIGGRQSCEWWIDPNGIGQMLEGEERGVSPIIYAHYFVETGDRPRERQFKQTCPSKLRLLYVGERAMAKSFKAGMKSKGVTYKWKDDYKSALIYSVYWPLLDPIFKEHDVRQTLEAVIHADLVSLFRLTPKILPCNIGMHYHKEKANLRIIHQCKYLILADIMAMWPTASLGPVQTT